MKQRFLMAMAMSAIVGGCTTPAREDGAYVSLLRDAMVEAARVADDPSGMPPRPCAPSRPGVPAKTVRSPADLPLPAASPTECDVGVAAWR